MVKKRKRAPGGGRKPDPNKKVLFTIRLEPYLLAELKAQAQEWQGSKGNVSAFTESLINKGLRDRAEAQRDPALQALLFFIGQLAESMSGGWPIQPGFTSQWRTDPFRFKAFKLAVGKLLNALPEPVGELKRPNLLENIQRMGVTPQQAGEALVRNAPKLQLSPEDLAFHLARVHAETETPERFAALNLIMLLERANNTAPPDEFDREMFTASFGKVAKREFYGLPKALHDLQLQPKTGGNDND